MKEWFKAAGLRALYTFAEVMLGFLTVGMAISEVSWVHALSVSVVAAIIALLKSIVTLPELKKLDSDGEIIFGPDGMSKVILNTENVDATQVTLDVLESGDVSESDE